MRLTYRQFRALLNALHRGAPLIGWKSEERTVRSLVRRGMLSAFHPHPITLSGRALLKSDR